METSKDYSQYTDEQLAKEKAFYDERYEEAIKTADDNIKEIINEYSPNLVAKVLYNPYHVEIFVTETPGVQTSNFFRPMVFLKTNWTEGEKCVDTISPEFRNMFIELNMKNPAPEYIEHNLKCMELYRLFYTDKNFMEEFTTAVMFHFNGIREIDKSCTAIEREISERELARKTAERDEKRLQEFQNAVEEIRKWKETENQEGFVCLYRSDYTDDKNPKPYEFVYRKKNYLPSRTPQGKLIINYMPRYKDANIKYVSIYDIKNYQGKSII